MCIVSLVKSDSSFILTFNRDEDPERPYSIPEYLKGTDIFCPIDQISGGTWIGANSSKIYCIQNGAKFKHKRDLPYQKSRGLILLELLKTNDIEIIQKEISLYKIEPFTITIFDLHSFKLEVITYNGSSIDFEEKSNNNFIQCSSTLYSEDIKALIETEFQSLIPKLDESIFNFHQNYRIGGSLNHFLTRPATTSITQFILNENKLSCTFHDLLKQSSTQYILK